MKLRYKFYDGTTTLYSDEVTQTEGAAAVTKECSFTTDISTLVTGRIEVTLQYDEKGKITKICGVFDDIEDNLLQEPSGIDIRFDSTTGAYKDLITWTPYKFADADSFTSTISCYVTATGEDA